MTPPGQASPSTDGSYSNGWRNFTRLLFPPAILAMLRLDGHGQENLPANDGVILAANHLSYMDILALSLFVHRAGR
jgi:1-acyl-sn-glycerol-3-phosphate acyltransferase